MAVQRAELCSVYAYGQSEGIPSPRRLSQELVRSAAGQPKPTATLMISSSTNLVNTKLMNVTR